MKYVWVCTYGSLDVGYIRLSSMVRSMIPFDGSTSVPKSVGLSTDATFLSLSEEL